MSTPNGRRGFFWDEWDHGGSEWERISVPATECPRISERVLAEEKATAGDKWYRQEYLCEFVDREGAVFSRDVIDGAYQDYPGLALLFWSLVDFLWGSIWGRARPFRFGGGGTGIEFCW